MMLNKFEQGLSVVVIGASGGIGRAFIDHFLSCDNVESVHGLSRSAVDINDSKYKFGTIDLTDEISIENAASEVSQNKLIDIIIVATGLLHNENGVGPEKSLRNINLQNFEQIFAINTIGPALIMKYFLPKLTREKRSVFAALSARVGSISDNQLGGWYAYRASKSALNMLIKTSSIEVARKYKQAAIIGLHPGTVDTGLSSPFKGNVPEGKLFAPEYSAQKMIEVINEISPEQTGLTFDYTGTKIPF